ncbi:MAG: hypothetical protein KBD06_03975 [Candidatus Pacebacteria bacterium]|nr:hypothetical protein [Candidatus Paceibacterota bacterium]
MVTFLDNLLNKPVVPILLALAAATLLTALVMYKPVYTALGKFFKSLTLIAPLTDEEKRLEMQRKNIYMGAARAPESPRPLEAQPHPEARQNPVYVQSSVRIPDFGVGAGFKFGFGFAAGILAFSFLFMIGFSILFGTVMHSIISRTGQINPSQFRIR